jgi:hypothetical protein
MDIFADLTWRGLIHQTTDDAQLGAWLSAAAARCAPASIPRIARIGSAIGLTPSGA